MPDTDLPAGPGQPLDPPSSSPFGAPAGEAFAFSVEPADLPSGTAVGASSSAPGDGRPGLRRAAPWALGALVAMPLVAALVKMLGDRWYPAGDMAQAELHMRGFFRTPPLVGAAGRIMSDTGVQGSHPGPSLWVAMEPIYLLLGRSSFALMAAVVSVHLASIVAALWLAVRRGGLVLGALVAAALAGVVRAAGPAFAVEPWNPWLAVLPFAVFVLAAWSVLDGARGCWFLVALSGWHSVQSHAGYAPLVGAVMAGVFIADVVGGRRAGDLGRRTRMWGLVALLTGLMWLPPLLDQLKREPGNLAILWQHFLSPREPLLERGLVARIVADQVNLFGPWLVGPTLPGPGDLGPNLFGLVALAALWGYGALRARRRGHRGASRLHALLAATTFVGFLAVSRIFGGYFEYTIRWMWVLVATIVAAAVWSLVEGRGERAERLVALVAVGATIVAGVMGSLKVHDSVVIPGAADSEMVGNLAPLLTASLDPDQHYVIRWRDSATLGASAFGLVLELERQGYHLGVDLPSAAAALPHRVLPEFASAGVVTVIVGAHADTMMVPVLSEIVGFYDPRNELQKARYWILREGLVEWATAAGRDDVLGVLTGGGGSLVFLNPPLPPEQAAMALELQRLPHPALVLLDDPITIGNELLGAEVPGELAQVGTADPVIPG